MRVIRVAVFGLIMSLFVAQTNPVVAADCSKKSAQGWGLTEELAKWQATDLLLLSTGNLLIQNNTVYKPKHSCKLTLLGWTCTATAKVCAK